MIRFRNLLTRERLGTLGLDRVTFDLRRFALKECGAACQRARRADEIDECVKLAARLHPDLRTGAVAMRLRVAGALELVGAEGAALGGNALGGFLDQRQVGARDLARARTRCLIDQHHLGPQRPHHPRPLGRVALRHDGDEGIALDRADDREAGPHVSGGQLDHRLARGKLARALGVLDDPERGAVLLREAGQKVIELGENPAIHPRCQPVERH